MKNIKEIIARSVILLCLSDRCALEKSIIDGKIYSKKQREQQRLAIYQWLKNKDYYEMTMKKEKLFFELEVGSGFENEILSTQVQHEAVEPCLWTLGLVKKLSGYDQFVIDDFHPVLQICVNHTLKSVLKACSLKDVENLQLQNEISMLWHWRAIECNRPKFNVKNAILSTFGHDYEKILDCIQQFDNSQNDFIVNNKLFSELNIEEKISINSIAQWRHHAFEWIVGNKEWDIIELNT